MGSGASSATPCLAGFFALRCFSLITIWVTPESWAVKLITSLPHWFYTRILRVPKCFPAVGPSLDANSLHNSGGISMVDRKDLTREMGEEFVYWKALEEAIVSEVSQRLYERDIRTNALFQKEVEAVEKIKKRLSDALERWR